MNITITISNNDNGSRSKGEPSITMEAAAGKDEFEELKRWMDLITSLESEYPTSCKSSKAGKIFYNATEGRSE